MISTILGHSTVLFPAYGRTYNTSQEAVESWKSGKDFKIINGPYCSVRDSVALAEGGKVFIRWNRVDDVRVI